MTYLAQESSAAAGHPVELYEWTAGTESVRVTSGAVARTVTIGGVVRTFAPAIIKRTTVAHKPELTRAPLRVEVPYDDQVAALFVAFVPAVQVTLTIYRIHATDPGLEAYCYWTGFVRSVSWAGSMATIECDHLTAYLATTGLRFTYQTTCNHMLFSTPCGAVKATYSHAGVVTAVTGDTVTAAVFAAHGTGYFTGGVLALGLDLRMIVSVAGQVATLLLPIPGLAVGSNIVAIAACPHTYDVCVSRFNRAVGFGGFPSLPIKNPFEGGVV